MGQEEKGTTEDEMAGCHHWHDAHEFGWTPGVADEQGCLACSNSWSRKELSHWRRPCCWERLKAGGEADDRGWDGWMVTPSQRTRVWANSRRRWRTGKPGVLQSMGSQSQTQLSDWTATIDFICLFTLVHSKDKINFSCWINYYLYCWNAALVVC